MMTYQDEIFEIEEQDNYFHTNKNSKLINKNGKFQIFNQNNTIINNFNIGHPTQRFRQNYIQGP
jgi:hypothetical protein